MNETAARLVDDEDAAEAHTATASPPISKPKQRRNRARDFTARDGAVLRWIGEQYGVRLDVLAVLLGRFGPRGQPVSLRAVRNQIERWEEGKLVRRVRALTATWVTPTRLGLERVGLSLPVWPVPVTRVRHCHSVNVVRLWYETTQEAQTAPWISERMTYVERGREQTWHVPDGVLRNMDPEPGRPAKHIGIEVELTHKARRTYDEEVFGRLRNNLTGLLFFVPDETFAARLRRDVEFVQQHRRSNIRYEIRTLPQVPGVTYDGSW